MKKIVLVIMCVVLAVSSLTSCNTKESYDNYSHGLTIDGLYVNMDKYNAKAPDYSNTTYRCEDILDWCLEQVNGNEGEKLYETLDDYVYQYGNEFLTAIGLASRDIAKDGDICSLTLSFSIDGKELPDYASTSTYEISAEGDSIIRSVIGHKAKDEYVVQYTFTEDDGVFKGKTADVKVVVNSISMPDPIKEGAVERGLDKINEHLDGVTNLDTFIDALKPRLARLNLYTFIANKIQAIDNIEIPEEYVKYEKYRLNARLQQIGYDYEMYLKDANLTDKEVQEYCRSVAKENYICMLIYQTHTYKVTDKEIKEYFGENYDYLVELQGLPYLKLRMIRDSSLMAIANEITVTYKGEVIELNKDDSNTTEDSTTNQTENGGSSNSAETTE